MRQESEIFVVEAAQSDAWIRRNTPTPPDGPRGRVYVVGPFFDYAAAHRWFDAHLGMFEAMMIHTLTSPGELEVRRYEAVR